jgi:hypothetical protein
MARHYRAATADELAHLARRSRSGKRIGQGLCATKVTSIRGAFPRKRRDAPGRNRTSACGLGKPRELSQRLPLRERVDLEFLPPVELRIGNVDAPAPPPRCISIHAKTSRAASSPLDRWRLATCCWTRAKGCAAKTSSAVGRPHRNRSPLGNCSGDGCAGRLLAFQGVTCVKSLCALSLL